MRHSGDALRGFLVEIADEHGLTGPMVAAFNAGLLVRITGDTIAMYAPSNLDVLAQKILVSAHALPELTRSLRGLGSHPARPHEEHDRFFAPFISARARAERTRPAGSCPA